MAPPSLEEQDDEKNMMKGGSLEEDYKGSATEEATPEAGKKEDEKKP